MFWVLGWKWFWIKVSLDETGFGWKCRGWNCLLFWMKWYWTKVFLDAFFFCNLDESAPNHLERESCGTAFIGHWRVHQQHQERQARSCRRPIRDDLAVAFHRAASGDPSWRPRFAAHGTSYCSSAWWGHRVWGSSSEVGRKEPLSTDLVCSGGGDFSFSARVDNHGRWGKRGTRHPVSHRPGQSCHRALHWRNWCVWHDLQSSDVGRLQQVRGTLCFLLCSSFTPTPSDNMALSSLFKISCCLTNTSSPAWTTSVSHVCRTALAPSSNISRRHWSSVDPSSFGEDAGLESGRSCSTGRDRIWPNLIWPSLFGRIWPNRIWPIPHLAKVNWPHLAILIWPNLANFCWPNLAKPHLANFLFWWGPGRWGPGVGALRVGVWTERGPGGVGVILNKCGFTPYDILAFFEPLLWTSTVFTPYDILAFFGLPPRPYWPTLNPKLKTRPLGRE